MANIMLDKPVPNYVRAKEVSAYFKIGDATFWRWVKEREGFPQAFKVSARVALFDLTAIENYLRDQSAKASK
jgi:predicted DNA-binding transcriptional regulator AlpA